MSKIRLGSPSIPVFFTDEGTCIARLEDIWDGAREFAKIHNYNVIEGFGVMGVAPFIPERASVWLGYLKVPFDNPVEIYKQNETDESTWVAEWMVK